jgi:hypothetical protein
MDYRSILPGNADDYCEIAGYVGRESEREEPLARMTQIK